MKKIDKTKPVLVTGATGYVAAWVVKRLLDEGLTVHAAVRDPAKGKVAHLDKLAQNSKGSIRYFKSDLLDRGSYAEAMKGCELVFHTASPFITAVEDPQRDLIEPAVKGTENVLFTANETPSVKRVVVTSSVAAIYTDAVDCKNAPNGTLTEDIWNTTASIDYQPYSWSKTLAEKRAWEIAEGQPQWDLIVINPALVMGPSINPGVNTSESFRILKQMGDGTFKIGAPRLGIGLVDVRDVAEAHFKAGFEPHARGRYITVGHNTDIYEMAQTLVPRFGERYPVPKRKIPKWLLLLVGPSLNKSLTRRYIRNNVDVEWKADNSKIRKELGISFRPMKETMEDSFEDLAENGAFNK